MKTKIDERGRVERMSKAAMSMIEVVAQAICRRQVALRYPMGLPTERLEQLVDAYWDGFADDARAAIAALRVPTDDMMVAAEDAIPVLACFATREESPSFIAWQAMIDAALAEPTTGE